MAINKNIFKNAIVEFDTKFGSYIERWPRWLKGFMRGITTLGQPVILGIIAAILAAIAWQDGRLSVVYALALGVIAMNSNAVLKHYVHRPRPDTLYVSNMFFKTSSFPSGHSFGAAVMCSLFAYLGALYLPTPWDIATPVAMAASILLIGVSRVYLGAHYPTDVIAGWLLGGFAAIAIIVGVRL